MHKSIRQFLEDLQCLPGESNADWCTHLRCWKWPHVQKCSCVQYDGHECCTKENVCNLQSDQHVYLRIHGIKTFWGRTDYLVMFLDTKPTYFLRPHCRLLKKAEKQRCFTNSSNGLNNDRLFHHPLYCPFISLCCCDQSGLEGSRHSVIIIIPGSPYNLRIL